MARQYSHTQFFRRVPNVLLGRYFQIKKKVLLDLVFNELTETRVEPVFEAFKALPHDQQESIEAEFQDIDNMACQGGVMALTDEASFHGNTHFTESIAKVKGFHGKIMWAFLEHPNLWAGATLFLHSDNIAESFWKKRNDLPPTKPNVAEEFIKSLAQEISQYFYSKEGRGRNCKVEVFHRNGKEYFFAYPEDFAQSGVEWVRSQLANRARHPAFEIIFVYTKEEGSLDIYAPRNTKAIPKLQQIFAETILEYNQLDEFGGDKRVYDLDKLAKRDFIFKFSPDSGIEEVAIKKLRLSLKVGDKRRVTVEADPVPDALAIYDLIEQLKLPPHYVTQAEIKVTFSPTPGVRSRTRTFRVSYPNSCALRHDGRDLVIRKMLAASGI
ncbi:MAG: hypothetical protein G3M78_05175 [Candidatus Nitrohelix vancouverensis]|uniref:Uncharacterized protein n=1 Tax=Candidatus Nitrohelix vancouverensis TaxID=2705534 RepID=A0A7T0C1J8_9BACT|nr:MAG: hypothetical protein G3M78_05175 [Candidatus Nitrohelix vancouverensis]